MQDFGRAFTYVFEDENWFSKILVGSFFVLLSLFLVGIPFVLGYVVEIVQNVADGRSRPLPEWTGLGDKFVKGLVLAFGLLMWSIPSFVLSSTGALLLAVADPSAGGVTEMLGALLSYAATIYNLFLAFVSPAIIVKYSENPTLVAAFRFRGIFAFVKARLADYVVVFLLTVATAILAFLGLVLFCLGIIVTSFLASLVQAYLFGQLRRGASRT